MKRHRMLFGTCLSVSIAASSVSAHATMLPMPMTVPHTTVVPSHLRIGDQQFDASVAGFRAYLETTKVSDAPLYAQLAPDLVRLESRFEVARLVLVAGLMGGLVSGIYAFAGGKSCPEPAITEPNFAAKSAAWGACNGDNMRMTSTFAFISLGSFFVGTVGALAIAPGRADLLELVNKHNRLHPQPLRLEIGFNPTQGFAYGRAGVAF